MRITEIITETTSAGSIAVGAMGGTGTLPFGNPSIYDNVGSYTNAKKKKSSIKKGKYIKRTKESL